MLNRVLSEVSELGLTDAMNRRTTAAVILYTTSLLASLCVAVSVRQPDGTLELKYRLEEEQEIGVYVGNVRENIKSTALTRSGSCDVAFNAKAVIVISVFNR